MLTGFWAGLALDVAPPASGVLGEHALVFCVVGYGCGRLSGLTDRSAASALGVAALAAAAGEMLYVTAGLILGDPGISWPAIRSVLPPAVLQDVLVSPFVVFLIWKLGGPAAGPAGAAAARLRAGVAGSGPARLAGGAALPGSAGLAGRASWLAGPLGSGHGRKAGPAGSVRFSKSAARQADGWVGSGPGSVQPVRTQLHRGRRPRLRPGAGQAGSSAAVAQVRRLQPGRPVRVRIGRGRRGDGSISAALGAPRGRRYPLAGGILPVRRPRFRPDSGSAGRAGPRGASLGRAGPGSAGPGSAGTRSAGLGGTGSRGTAARLGGAAFSGAGLGRPRLGRMSLGRMKPGRAGLASALPGSSLRGSAMPGRRLRVGGPARPARLRLRGRRSADGAVGGGFLRAAAGGGPAGFRPKRRPRLFRRRPGPSRGQPRLARREPSFSRRQLGFPRRRPRIRGGRPSFVAGRPGGGRSGGFR
jgi:hypothetical protein